MAASVVSRVTLGLNSLLSNALGLAAGSAQIDRSVSVALASGVGANQADRVYSESQKSISGNYDLDLTGALFDAFGVACNFARVKAIIVIANDANPGNVLVGGIGATGFFGPFNANTDKLVVRPGGSAMLFAPDATAWPVTAASADILRFAPSAGTCVFDFAILGASA